MNRLSWSGCSRPFHTSVRSMASRRVPPPRVVTETSGQDPKATSPFLNALVNPVSARRGRTVERFQHPLTTQTVRFVKDTIPAYLTNENIMSGHDDVVLQQQMLAAQRILGLGTANAQGIKHYNIAQAIKLLGRTKVDTGSPEVQAAVWTIRIRDLEKHFTTHRKDVHNRRAYRQLVHKRAKMLKYLRRKDIAKYHETLKALGLRPEDVENEIVVK